MIRLECRHDVFHAHGDARVGRDGGRASFFTNSPHNEIYEGLGQQVADKGPRVLHDAHSKWNTSQALRLDHPSSPPPPQTLKRRSRRSEGGQTVQELNSIREGKYWGRCQRRMVGSNLDPEGASGGDAVRKEALVFSATSPLEGVRLVISEAASSNQKGTVLLVIDVRRAYFQRRRSAEST